MPRRNSNQEGQIGDVSQPGDAGRAAGGGPSESVPSASPFDSAAPIPGEPSPPLPIEGLAEETSPATADDAGIGPPESAETRSRRAFFGRSGHLAVMSEFLHRRINVAIPEVDVGDD